MNTLTQDLTPDTSPPTPGTRLFARIYDPIMWLGERRAMRERRRGLLGRARGVTLEIGSGTGLNLPHYPSELDRLVLTEPDDAMRTRLERRTARLRSDASVIGAPAERLPFDDGEVDTVVSTLVLCTVPSPQLALREIARVLAPDGQLLFIEHVRASSPIRSFWQDALAAPWRAFAGGCCCNRQTIAMMASAGFELDVCEASWRGMPGIVRPLVFGRAASAGGALDTLA
jgi:ubiquinone/menaquinone biosynthesis C-methylase UbiE